MLLKLGSLWDTQNKHCPDENFLFVCRGKFQDLKKKIEGEKYVLPVLS